MRERDIKRKTNGERKMSGGHFDYKDMQMHEWIDIIKRDDYPTDKLEKLLESMMNILHAYDWFRSGDTGEGEFKKEYFKEIKKIKELLK